MTTLLEGNLRITLPRGARARKFDDSTHGLLHRHMKAVDFVIEMDDRMLYLEVKDPEHPKARTEQREEFIARFLAADKDDELIRKFRDSLLYEWACDEVHKPIYYWVIVAIEKLAAPELSSRSDDLKRKLPVVEALPARWTRRIVEDCRVFNIRSWNEALPEGYRLERVSI